MGLPWRKVKESCGLYSAGRIQAVYLALTRLRTSATVPKDFLLGISKISVQVKIVAKDLIFGTL